MVLVCDEGKPQFVRRESGTAYRWHEDEAGSTIDAGRCELALEYGGWMSGEPDLSLLRTRIRIPTS